jgi:potassium-transporting ATPase KdpC subunit
MNLSKQIYPAVAMMLILTVITGVIYPFLVTGLSQVLFKSQAQGSLIEKNGEIIGSRLIGQTFTKPGYFHSRPSAAGNGYDSMASGGTNLGPTNKKLLEGNVKGVVEALSKENPKVPIPVDLVTSSGSGLDPHITPAAAEFQIERVALERGISPNELRQLVKEHTEGRQFGFLGEPRVNVLELNLALDAIRPISQ